MAQRRGGIPQAEGHSPMLKDRRNGQKSKGQVVPLAGIWTLARNTSVPHDEGQRSMSNVTCQVQMSSGDPL